MTYANRGASIVKWTDINIVMSSSTILRTKHMPKLINCGQEMM